MEKTFQNKSNVNKTKDRKSKKIETFARDFKMYSKMIKQNPNKNEQTKEKSDLKKRLKMDGSKRHKRNIQSHNQYTIDALKLGITNNSNKTSPKNVYASRPNTERNPQFKDNKTHKQNAKRDAFIIDQQLKFTKSPDLKKDFKKKFNFKSANAKQKKIIANQIENQNENFDIESKKLSKKSIYNQTKDLNIELPNEEIISSENDSFSNEQMSLQNKKYLKNSYRPETEKNKIQTKSYNVSYERNLVNISKNKKKFFSKLNSSQIKLQQKIKNQKPREIKVPNPSITTSPQTSKANSIKNKSNLNRHLMNEKNKNWKDYRNDFDPLNKPNFKNTSRLKDDTLGVKASNNFASISSRGYPTESIVGNMKISTKIKNKTKIAHSRHYSNNLNNLNKNLSAISHVKNKGSLTNSQLSSQLSHQQTNFDSSLKGSKLVSQTHNLNFKKQRMNNLKTPKNINLKKELDVNSVFNKKHNSNKYSIGTSNIKLSKKVKHQKAQSIGNYEISNLLSKQKFSKNKNRKTSDIGTNNEIINKQELPFSFAPKNNIIKSNTNKSNKLKSISRNQDNISDDNSSSNLNIDIKNKKIVIESIENSLKEKTEGSLHFTKSYKTNQSNQNKKSLKKMPTGSSNRNENGSYKYNNTKNNKFTLNIQKLMKPKFNMKSSQKINLNSSKKIETSSNRKAKPLFGSKINSKDYESFNNVSRKFLQAETNRLNQTTGYSNPLSMAKLRDYTTNDSNYQKEINKLNTSNKNQNHSKKLFKKKNQTDILLSPTNLSQDKDGHFNFKNKSSKSITKNTSTAYSKDNDLRQFQKYIIEKKNNELSNSDIRICNSNVLISEPNMNNNNEGFISQRMIMYDLPPNEMNQFKSHRQNNNLKFYHQRSKTGNVEELVDYIYEMSQKKKSNIDDKNKEIIIDNVDDLINSNITKRSNSNTMKSNIIAKHKLSSKLNSDNLEFVKERNNNMITPKHLKPRNYQRGSKHSQNSSKNLNDFINKSNPERKESLNIYKNEFNKSERVQSKSQVNSPEKINHLKHANEDMNKIQVYDKNGKAYWISRVHLESGNKAKKNKNSLSPIKKESALINFKKRVEILTETQKQENLANHIINNNTNTNDDNINQRNIDFPNEEGIFNTTDIDSYAKEISENDMLNIQNNNFKDSINVQNNNILTINSICNDSDKHIPSNFKKLDDNQNITNNISHKQKVIVSRINKGKAKVFNLCSFDEEDKSGPKKINVSKKDDSGTDFFAVNGKISSREIQKPKKVFEIFENEIEDDNSEDYNIINRIENYNESIEQKRLEFTSSFDSNNSSIKFSNLRNKMISNPSNDKINNDKSNPNEYTNLLYKKNLNKNYDSSSETSERNMYQRLQSSMAPPMKVNKNINNQNNDNSKVGSNTKIGIEKVKLGQNNLHSARMIEDLKKFSKETAIEQFKKNSIASQKNKLQNKKINDTVRKKNIPQKNKIKNNDVVAKRRRGHKRNVHSEQYTDLIKQVVKKHEIPVQLEYNNANMTPDLSRKNSLNISDDEIEIQKKDNKKIKDNSNINKNIFDSRLRDKNSVVYNYSSFEKLEESNPLNDQNCENKNNLKNSILEKNEESKPQKSIRIIDFINVNDESDMTHVKNSHSNPLNLKEFEDRNKKEIKKFELKNKIDSKHYSPQSELIPKAPLQTKEISQYTMAKESSKNSQAHYSKNKNSGNTSSKKNLSFGQISGRGSKISITIMTHKSSKNSDFNNNIVISHSLQNSGVHNPPLKNNTNVFKLESPDPGSGAHSPHDGIRIEVKEERNLSEDNLDRMPTINPKNLTFNPNNQKIFEINEAEETSKMTQKEFKEDENQNINDKDIKDLQIPQMGSSYEDSLASYHSEYSDNKNFNEITENTFGKGMNIVIKEAKSKNIFNDSLNASSQIQVNSDRNSLNNKNNIQNQKRKEIEQTENKNIVKNNIYKNPSDNASPSNQNPATEFYYERDHVNNGDSSYKLSISDNSSNLKNITLKTNSNNQRKSSLNESPDIRPSLNHNKSKQAILRGKLNSPIKTKKNISKEKTFKLEEISIKKKKIERNDNIMKIKDDEAEKAVENMTHSELVEFRNKNARKKYTQIYDNKSAMVMLESQKNKNKSANTSPHKNKRKYISSSKNTSIDKKNKKDGYIKISSKRDIKKTSTNKKIDFVNLTNEESIKENQTREKIKKKKNYSRKTSRNNSIDDRFKKNTIEKERKKTSSKIKNKKKLDSTEQISDSSKSKNNFKSNVKKKEKKQKKDKSVSNKKEIKNNFSSNLKISKKKQVLEIKIMKHIAQGENIETNLEFYDVKKKLGEGSYAKVYLGASVLSGKKVALKLYDKSKIKSKTSSERIFTEIDILRRMNHRNIVNLIEIFQNKKFIFIVLEYANGGDLLNYLKNYGRFKESDFRNILQQIVDGLEYIHDYKYLHRDIKLDNILLTKQGLVKICDFGISRKMSSKDKIFEHIGTPAYIAPEIIKENGYSGFGADIWSLGVTTFMALTGNVPFKGNTIEELHESILNNDIKFPEKIKLSEEMKRAIRGMLIKDPTKRMSLKDVCRILDLRRALGKRTNDNYADDKVIQEIKLFGYPEKMIKESLKKDIINHITALYKLMSN